MAKDLTATFGRALWRGEAETIAALASKVDPNAITRLLLAYGADPDLCDRRGVSVRASARLPQLRALLEEHRHHSGSPATTPTP